MDYLWLKLIHILSATILFGTGIGSAFYMFMANRRKDIAGIYFATRHVVIADWISYSLTLHAASNERLVGFDNAHSVPKAKDKAHDHKHRFKIVKPYEYKDAGTLLEDFWKTVEKVLKERGVR